MDKARGYVARHREQVSTAFSRRQLTPTRTPRPMCSRVTTTGGRSPGSRVNAFHRLPRRERPVALGERLAAYSCGGSRGIKLVRKNSPSPHSLLIPEGNRRLHVRVRCRNVSTSSVRSASLRAWCSIHQHATAVTHDCCDGLSQARQQNSLEPFSSETSRSLPWPSHFPAAVSCLPPQ